MALNSTAGDPAAESYFSIIEADTYFTARGVASWTGAESVKEAAARKATQYIDNEYRVRWVGVTSTQTQALAWPRIDGARGARGSAYGSGFTYPLTDLNGWEIPTNVVPDQIKRAAMEAALLSLSGRALEPTLERGGQVKSIDKGVGPLRKVITYMDGAPAVNRYTAIDGYLRGLVSSPNRREVVRA